MSSYSYLKRKLAKKTLLDMYGSRLPQIGAPGGTAGVGKVFFVNGSTGSDSAQGVSADSPFKTIVYALTQCTDRNDDTILVTRDPSEDAYPVSINKRDIHIIGWDAPTRLGAEKIYFGSGSAAGFEIAAQNVEIAGFDFAATSSYPAIQFLAGTNYWNAAIHDNVFGKRGALQDGIYIDTGLDENSACIYDNVFEYQIARDGVRILGTMSWGYIGFPGHGNVFREVDGIGINITSAAVLAGIHDNRFALPSDTAGKAISFTNAGSSGCWVDGNSANYLVIADNTNKAYRDLGNNHWGLNYHNTSAIMPVTT